jgi:oligoribonuclease NrnB/cAMP/cGMP phosphodiesterase (DHH superfamily)
VEFKPLEFKAGTVLYHRNCTDGFMSAYVFSVFTRALGIEMDYIAVQYNEPIPEITRKDRVYLLDFSFQPEELIHLQRVAKEVVMLDHHEAAWSVYGCGEKCEECVLPDETGRERKSSLFTRLINEKSGAGLALDYAYAAYKAVPEPKYRFTEESLATLRWLVVRVEDRDLWNFKYPETKAVHAMLNAKPFTMDYWDEIIFGPVARFKELLKDAKIQEELKEHYTQKWAKLHHVVRFQGMDIAVVNCPSDFASAVGDMLSANYPMALMWTASTTKVFMSLRSNKTTGVNVMEIAKLFGGNGHKNAAGCSISVEQLPDLLGGRL